MDNLAPSVHSPTSIPKLPPRPIIPHIPTPLTPRPQPIIPRSPRPLPILPTQSKQENRAHKTTHKQHAQTSPITGFIRRALGREEDVRGDDPAEVAETDLQSRGDGALVVS